MKNWHQFVFYHKNLSNCSLSLVAALHKINYKFVCLSTYWQWKLANEGARISAVIVKFTIENESSKSWWCVPHSPTPTSQKRLSKPPYWETLWNGDPSVKLTTWEELLKNTGQKHNSYTCNVSLVQTVKENSLNNTVKKLKKLAKILFPSSREK